MIDRPAPTPAGIDIGLFLVSHTNVGKTTLIRTLLGQDIGEIEDAPHVTKVLTAYDLVSDQAANTLRLWDTPGFGDSFRLAKRLKQKRAWLGWVIRELWDRRINPDLWRGQRLALDLRARASVVLYTVNLAERPVDAVYVTPELEILAWVGKPVLVVLNQLGVLSDPALGAARQAEWRSELANFAVVQRVLSLDGYSRCWVQELLLFNDIANLLPESVQTVYRGLAKLLRQSYAKRLEASASAIAHYMVQMAGDHDAIDAHWFDGLKSGWDKLRSGTRLGRDPDMAPFASVMQGLAQRYAERTKALTETLIGINRLDGVSVADIMDVAAGQVLINQPVNGATTAIGGGVISGILAGLSADLLAGGMTVGAGALIGGLMGAFGGAALAKGYNIYTHKNQRVVRWSPESLAEAFVKAVMLYLSIAHFGRGQGQWHRKQDPELWAAVVEEARQRDQESLNRLWADISAASASTSASSDSNETGASATRDFLRQILLQLYPQASTVLTD